MIGWITFVECMLNIYVYTHNPCNHDNCSQFIECLFVDGIHSCNFVCFRAAANLGESVKNAYLDLQLINAKYKEANPPLPHCGLKTIPLVVQALFPKASYRNEKFWGLTVRPKEYPDPSTITLPPNCKFKQVDGILRIDCPTKYIFDGKTVVGHIRIHQNLALDVKMLEKQIELPNFGISKTLQRISQNELSGIVHIVQQANVCIGLLYDAQKHDEHIMNLLKVVKRDVALGEKSEKREARLFSERCNIWVKMTKDPSECTMCQSCCEVFKNFSDPASGGESSVKTKPSPAKKLVEEVSSLPSGKRSKADPPLLQKVLTTGTR